MNTSRFVRLFVALLTLILGASSAQAAEQFQLRLTDFAAYDSCVPAILASEGELLFEVNALQLPTYTIPGTFKQWTNGATYNEFAASFSGTLLRKGTNDLVLHAHGSNGADPCIHIDLDGFLESPTLGSKPVFMVRIKGMGFDGQTQVDLSLREIDPHLADDIDRLKGLIDGRKAQLNSTGHNADAAAAEWARLDQLIHDVDALIALGFDGITEAALKSLLDQYADMLTPSLRDALTQLVHDLKEDIEELRAQIDEISNAFADRTNAVTSVLDGVPGFPAEDPHAYEPVTNTDGVPPVQVPDILGTDPFDGTHDPYADFADEVLAQLASTIAPDGRVLDHGRFLDIVGNWRFNMAALEQSLVLREAVSQAEYGAFLNAKARVTNRLSNFVDARDWFLDTEVPQQIRDFIDLGLAANAFLQYATLKRAFNEFPELTEHQYDLLWTMVIIHGAAERVWGPPPPPGFLDELLEIINVYGAVYRFAGSVAIGFTPAGDFVDLCEAVTGWELCIPGGNTLSVRERVMAAAGLVIFNREVWGRAGDVLDGIAGGIGCLGFRADARSSRPCPRKIAKVARTLEEALDEVRRFQPSPDNPVIKAVEHLPDGRTIFHTHSGFSVTYSERGFPDFSPFRRPEFDGKLSDVHIDLCGPPNRNCDFRRANIAAGFGDTPDAPDGYVWHHHEELGRMQLINVEVHNIADGGLPHTGGFAYWKKIWEFTENE
jgi:hypothetical protein